MDHEVSRFWGFHLSGVIEQMVKWPVKLGKPSIHVQRIIAQFEIRQVGVDEAILCNHIDAEETSLHWVALDLPLITWFSTGLVQ
ncbi:hypothetical protein D3C86_2018920 [compost metagenome]